MVVSKTEFEAMKNELNKWAAKQDALLEDLNHRITQLEKVKKPTPKPAEKKAAA